MNERRTFLTILLSAIAIGPVALVGGLRGRRKLTPVVRGKVHTQTIEQMSVKMRDHADDIVKIVFDLKTDIRFEDQKHLFDKLIATAGLIVEDADYIDTKEEREKLFPFNEQSQHKGTRAKRRR